MNHQSTYWRLGDLWQRKSNICAMYSAWLLPLVLPLDARLAWPIIINQNKYVYDISGIFTTRSWTQNLGGLMKKKHLTLCYNIKIHEYKEEESFERNMGKWVIQGKPRPSRELSKVVEKKEKKSNIGYIVIL